MNKQKLEYLIERLKEDKHSKRTETIQIVLQELQEFHKLQFGHYYHFREKAFYDSPQNSSKNNLSSFNFADTKNRDTTPQDVNSPAEVFPISKQASEYQKRNCPVTSSRKECDELPTNHNVDGIDKYAGRDKIPYDSPPNAVPTLKDAHTSNRSATSKVDNIPYNADSLVKMPDVAGGDVGLKASIIQRKRNSSPSQDTIPYDEVLLPDREQITPEQFELNFREAL